MILSILRQAPTPYFRQGQSAIKKNKDETERDRNPIQVPGSSHFEGLFISLPSGSCFLFSCFVWDKGAGKWVLLLAAYTQPLPNGSYYIS